MKTHKLASCAVVLAFLLAPCKALPAQKPDCGEVAAMAKMARTISSAELVAEKKNAGDSYRAQIVFAARLSELDPQGHEAAVLLLNLIPKDDEQGHALMSLGDGLCGTESYRDMKQLGQIGEHLPRDWAKAVLLAPDKLPEFVAYSIISVRDPHSDYAIQMEKVCRVKHSEFVNAVAKLPLEKQQQFLKYVFSLDGCHALALPEGD
ncbi:MAG: hypothetical protein ABSF70_02480 [Terracidiphilus sp.]|jgi:hypothetical protein